MTDLFDLPFEDEPQEPSPAEPTPPARRVYTVSELTSEIRGLLETRFFEVWVEGEISNCRVWNTGHVYFTLKDANAQLKAVMFRSAVRALRFKPEDGLAVIARGRLSVYDPKGEYQIVCEHLEPKGFGALQVAFEQLKARLQAEGLFEAARKRPLPVLPRKIGIVTSLDGAAVRDIIKVIQRRHPRSHLIVAPARVQGEGAARDLARALTAVARVKGVDVVIVGRGGGSIEDLWAFNEEVLARAIARSPVPVVSAVGHEVDVTIADFVADLRAPTPSAAGEMVLARKDDYCARIERLEERMRGVTRQRLERLRVRLHRTETRPGLAGFKGRLALRGRHADELAWEVARLVRGRLGRAERRWQAARLRLEMFDLRRRLGGLRTRLVRADGQLHAAEVRAHNQADRRLRGLAARLETLSPLAVLGRGYAVCWNADHTAIVRDAAATRAGDRVNVALERGELACRVEQIKDGRK